MSRFLAYRPGSYRLTRQSPGLSGCAPYAPVEPAVVRIGRFGLEKGAILPFRLSGGRLRPSRGVARRLGRGGARVGLEALPVGPRASLQLQVAGVLTKTPYGERTEAKPKAPFKLDVRYRNYDNYGSYRN